jgi:hypothetical protein
MMVLVKLLLMPYRCLNPLKALKLERPLASAILALPINYIIVKYHKTTDSP